MKEFIIKNIDIILACIGMLVWLVIDIIRALKTKNYDKVKDRLLEIMEFVEKYKTSDGKSLGAEYKLAFAKSMLIKECKENNVAYNDDEITNIIERMIEFSKKVNNKEGDEENA